MAPLNRRDDFVWLPRELVRLSGWTVVRDAAVAGFRDVVTDSRRATPGALFVALRGERHDGHDFAAEAVARGARGVVIDHELPGRIPDGVTVFHVESTTAALMQIAALKRRAYRGTVVALTGSMGKTTTKHFADCLAGDSISVTTGNFNNQIGVPLSIIAASLRARAWVLELGMNAAGEIGQLTSLVRPDLGVLLPAGRAHLGGFSAVDEIVAAKAEMLRVTEAPRRVLTVGNQYDQWLTPGQEHLRIGAGGKYAARPTRIRFPSGTRFTIVDRDRRLDRVVPVHGGHFATPLAAAWAIVRECGVSQAAAARRLSRLRSPTGRMTLLPHRGGWLLDDSYNASPEAFLAFAQWLAHVPLKLRLAIADMRELGAAAGQLHQEVAAALAPLHATAIVALEGELAAALADAGCTVRIAADADEAVRLLLRDWEPGTLAAVKGAHGSGLYAALRRSGF